jgi:group I intron endonuclease
MNGIEDYEELKNLGGVYFIWCIPNKKYYIGRTNSFITRNNKHSNDLKNRLHKNKFLQADWNIYGEDNFVFGVANEIYYYTRQKAVEMEQFWLDYYKPWDRNIGYNISKKANGWDGSLLSREDREKIGINIRGRSFEIVSPKGELIKSKGLRTFCRNNKISVEPMRLVLDGKLKHYNGWHLESTEINLTKFENYKFISPSGELVEIERLKLKDFCRKNKIGYRGILSMWQKVSPYCAGWSRFDNPQHRILLSPSNEIFYLGMGYTRQFAEKHNLHYSGLRSIINGNCITHRGWKYLGMLKLENVNNLCPV